VYELAEYFAPHGLTLTDVSGGLAELQTLRGLDNSVEGRAEAIRELCALAQVPGAVPTAVPPHLLPDGFVQYPAESYSGTDVAAANMAAQEAMLGLSAEAETFPAYGALPSDPVMDAADAVILSMHRRSPRTGNYF
jgi:hypothetical protein